MFRASEIPRADHPISSPTASYVLCLTCFDVWFADLFCSLIPERGCETTQMAGAWDLTDHFRIVDGQWLSLRGACWFNWPVLDSGFQFHDSECNLLHHSLFQFSSFLTRENFSLHLNGSPSRRVSRSLYPYEVLSVGGRKIFYFQYTLSFLYFYIIPFVNLAQWLNSLSFINIRSVARVWSHWSAQGTLLRIRLTPRSKSQCWVL